MSALAPRRSLPTTLRRGPGAFALGLGPALALAFALAFSLACSSDEQELARHLERGQASMDEGAYPEAILEYKKALQLDPNHADAHYGLARAFLADEKLRQGYWELQETVRLDPDALDARLQYGELARLAGEHETALQQAEAVIERAPERTGAWMLKARTLENLERPDEAQQVYEEAVERFPEARTPHYELARFYVSEGEREPAEPLLREVVRLDPSFRSYAALAGFLAADPGRAQDDEAEAMFRRALEAAEEDELGTAYRMLSSFYYARGRHDEAEAVLDRALEARPDDLELMYLVARFHAARGDRERADALMEEATRARPGDVRPHLVLATYRRRQGDLEGALEAVETALAVDSGHVVARLRKAGVLLDLGYGRDDPERIARGRSIVNAVLAESPRHPEALFVRARLDLADGDPASAEDRLRRALDRKPDWAEGHHLLATALFLQDRLTAARAELADALELDGQLLDARRLQVRVHARLGDHALAVEAGRAVLEHRPEDHDTRLLVARSLVRLGRPDAALAELREIPEDARTAETHYAMARIHGLEGRPEQARRHYERAAATQPHEPKILEALLALDRREGRLAESMQRIAAAAAARPENAQIARLQGIAHAYAGDAGKAETALRRAIELDPQNLAPYQSLAQILAAGGRREEVLRTYERAAESRPDAAQLHLVVGTLHEIFGSESEAISAYERAIRADPELAPAKNNLAYLLAERGEALDRALDLAREARGRLPEDGRIADTLGWVLYRKGMPEAAVDYLEEAESLFEPRDPSLAMVRHHLALAQEAAGEPEAARATLERALRDLEAVQAAQRERTGEAPATPGWVAELRSMLERLRRDASVAQEAHAEG